MDQPMAKLEGAERLPLSGFLHEFMSVVTHNNLAHSAASQFIDIVRTYLGPTNRVPTYAQMQKLFKDVNIMQAEAFVVCECDDDLDRTPLRQMSDETKRSRVCKCCGARMFTDKLIAKKVSTFETHQRER